MSPGEPGPYRESIEKGIRYVLAHQQQNGSAGLEHEPRADVLPRDQHADARRGRRHDADRELADRMQTAPGPRGQADPGLAQNVSKSAEPCRRLAVSAASSNDSDISVTGWQLMALRAAKAAGCDGALGEHRPGGRVLETVRGQRGGGFGYQPGGGPNNARTGTGILALEICGEHLTPEAVAGAEYLLKHPPHWSTQYFFYEVYYCPIAMFQMGDKYFLPYYSKLAAILLEHQHADGSWLSDDGNDRTGGRELLHGDGRAGADGRVSVFADLSTVSVSCQLLMRSCELDPIGPAPCGG